MSKGKYKFDEITLTDVQLKSDDANYKDKKYKIVIPKQEKGIETDDKGIAKVSGVQVFEGDDTTANTTLKTAEIELDKGFIRNGFKLKKIGNFEVKEEKGFNTKGFTRTFHGAWISLTVLAVIGLA